MIEPYILEYKHLINIDNSINKSYLNDFINNILLNVSLSYNKIVIIKLINNAGFEVLINILYGVTYESIYDRIITILNHDLPE